MDMAVGKTERQFLDELWRDLAGVPPLPEPLQMPPLEELRQTEWRPDFEALMRSRLLIGAFRYGRICAKDKPKYNRIAAAHKRLAEYERSGNLDAIVDVANFMLLEFAEGEHPLRHFASGDREDHVEMGK